MWKKCNGISVTTLHCRIDFYKNRPHSINMKLQVPVYSSDMFTWKGNRGCAEASDFGSLEKKGYFIGARCYDDACDIGFYVVSARTGAKMLFTYVHDEDGYDGELQVYSSGDFTITIFND